MECKKNIVKILSRLDTEYESVEQINKLEYECLTMLTQLEARCSDRLSEIGKQLLERSNESNDDEYKLQIVLQAIINRNQTNALDISIAALVSDKTQDKETYVEILTSFEDPSSIPALCFAIENDKSIGEEEGRVRSKAIEALQDIGAEDVASFIVPYVKDSAYRVRKAAVNFLVNLNISRAIPLFLEQLIEEENPYNLEAIIRGLVHWNCTKALPELRELLKSDWVNNDRLLFTVVSEAILALDLVNDQRQSKSHDDNFSDK